jgi:regulatory protein
MTQPDSITVKELRESPRRPGRYLLSLSDGRQLLVGVAVLADTGATRAGIALSPAAIERLVHEATITDLADRALASLARGRRSRRELEMRLRRREATPEQIREALDRLEQAGLLSDEAVAQAEAAARLRRGEAPMRVQQQLRRKGVAAPTVTAAVADAMREDGFDELAACRAVAEKRARSLKTTDPVAAERRLLGFLLRRGYGGSTARRVTKEVLARRETHDDVGDEGAFDDE